MGEVSGVGGSKNIQKPPVNNLQIQEKLMHQKEAMKIALDELDNVSSDMRVTSRAKFAIGSILKSDQLATKQDYQNVLNRLNEIIQGSGTPAMKKLKETFLKLQKEAPEGKSETTKTAQANTGDTYKPSSKSNSEIVEGADTVWGKLPPF